MSRELPDNLVAIGVNRVFLPHAILKINKKNTDFFLESCCQNPGVIIF